MGDREIELRSQLRLYEADDARESGHLERMRELCDSVADPCSRTSFAPGHFTASAFILSPERDALLLILHGKLGRWLQPGGHVDPTDRDLLAAALREVREEVGLVDLSLLRSHARGRASTAQPGPFDLDVHDIPARKDEPAHAHFDVRYLFRAQSREVTAASDAKDARWVPLGDIHAEFSDASVMRAVAKLASIALIRLPRSASLRAAYPRASAPKTECVLPIERALDDVGEREMGQQLGRARAGTWGDQSNTGSERPHDGRRVDALRPQFGERARAVALGEPLAVGSAQQRDMHECRRPTAERLIERELPARAASQVFSTQRLR